MKYLSNKFIFAFIIISQSFMYSCVGNNNSNTNRGETNSEKILKIFQLDNSIVDPEIEVFPTNGYDNVSPDSNIVIYFNQPVDEFGGWKVDINSVTYTADSADIEWNWGFDENGSYYVLIIHPATVLPRAQTVTVNTHGFRVRDLFLYFDDITSCFTTSGGTLNVTLTPSDGAKNILSDSNVSIKFSEYAERDSDWQVVVDGITYNKSTAGIFWDADHILLTINPIGYFPRKGTVLVSTTGFRASRDGYPFPNANGSFTIIDGPTAAFNPAGEVKAVPLDQNVFITFTEGMVIDNDWLVTLAGIDYDKNSPSVSWSSDHKVLTIDPAANLPVMARVTAVLQNFHAAKDNALFSGPAASSFFTTMLIEKIDAAIAWEKTALFSIAIDSTNAIHIGYANDHPANYLNYITNKSGTWQYQQITKGTVSSIATDSNDVAHMAYQANISSGGGYDVHSGYANNAGGSWSTTIIDASNLVGYLPSIAIDKSDIVHMLYWDEINCVIRYATNGGGSWVSQSVDDLGSWDTYPSSIAVDHDNTVHITYYTGSILKYGRYKDGLWVLSTIDSSNYAGSNNNCTVDSNGAVHVVYSDFDNASYKSRVKYATNKSGSWSIVVIDPNNNYTHPMSIAIDSSDKVHIAYINGGDGPASGNYNNYVKYVTNKNGSWDMYWIDSGIYIGDNSSMALDSSGDAHIIYAKINTTCEFKHATNKN